MTALEHNVNQIRGQLPAGCEYLGVVKANAYGHGAVPIARKLQEIGVEHLAVASFDEAAERREAGITAKILILGPSPSWMAKERPSRRFSPMVKNFTKFLTCISLILCSPKC